MPGVPKSIQTEHSFELMVHFIEKDLPRLISYDVVPLLYQAINSAQNDANSHQTLQQGIEELVRGLVKKHIHQQVGAKEQEDAYQGPGRCKICSKGMEELSLGQILFHMEAFHSKGSTQGFPCPLCERKYTVFEDAGLRYPSELGRHLRLGHPYVVCSFCKKAFRNRRSLSAHQLSAHTDDSTCPKCNVSFSFPSQLRSHMKFSKSCGYTVTKPQGRHEVAPPPAEANPTRPTKDTANMITSTLLSVLGKEADEAAPATPSESCSSVMASNSVVQKVATAILEDSDVRMDVGGSLPEGKSNSDLETSTEDMNLNRKRGPISTAANTRQKLSAKGYAPTSTIYKMNDPSAFQCDLCNKKYQSLSILNHHKQKMHYEQKTLSCSHCYRMFATFNDLESHFHRIHRSSKTSKLKTSQSNTGVSNAIEDNESKSTSEPVKEMG